MFRKVFYLIAGIISVPLIGFLIGVTVRSRIFDMQMKQKTRAQELALALAGEMGAANPSFQAMAGREYQLALQEKFKKFVDDNQGVTDVLALLFSGGVGQGSLVTRHNIVPANEQQRKKFGEPVQADQNKVLVLLIAPIIRTPIITSEGKLIGILELHFEASNSMKRAAWLWRMALVLFGFCLVGIVIGEVILWRRP